MLLVTYNIHFGLGADNRYDIDRVADVVAQADIVCLQEVVQGWALNAYADQAAEIAHRLDRYVWFHAPVDSDASERGPDGCLVNRRRTFGNALLSRWPIRTATGHILPKSALAAGFDLQRGFIEAMVAAPGRDLRIYNAHLTDHSPARRAPQLSTLLRVVSQARAHGPMWDNVTESLVGFGEPAPRVPDDAIIMGDFNFRPEDPEYLKVCAALADAWRLAGNAEDRHSFPQWGRIDHCFVTPSVAPHVRRAWIDDGTAASDHWPLFVEIDRG
jgi:endonuclease/exonuclease/phosphatase family metal-dependent hydrolase